MTNIGLSDIINLLLSHYSTHLDFLYTEIYGG